MTTAEQEVETDLDEDVPYSDTVYPPELLEQWEREVTITELKIKTGEIKIKSLREQFEEHGFKVD